MTENEKKLILIEGFMAILSLHDSPNPHCCPHCEGRNEKQIREDMPSYWHIIKIMDRDSYPSPLTSKDSNLNGLNELCWTCRDIVFWARNLVQEEQ